MAFRQKFEIDGCYIGEGCPTYVIAEMSANHGGDLNNAIEIIKKAKECGADAIKIQTYTADTLTLNCKKKAFEAKDSDRIDVFSVDHTRCFCYVSDAIEMLWRMMNSENCENQTLNLGTQSPEVTMKNLAEVCHNATEKKLFINENPATPGSPYRRCPDMNKTIELIDFESQVDLHDGIAKTYDWYREYIFEGKNISAL